MDVNSTFVAESLPTEFAFCPCGVSKSQKLSVDLIKFPLNS